MGVYVILEGLDLYAMVRALARAELATRVGWWAKKHQIPIWFEEGLVGQLRRWGMDVSRKLRHSAMPR